MSEPGTAWERADLWGPPRPTRPLGLRDAALGIGLVVVAQLLAAGVAVWQVATGAVQDAAQAAASPAVVLAGLMALWAAFLGAPLLVARRTRTSLGEVTGSGRPSAVALLWGAGLGLALRAGSLAAGWLAQALGMPAGENTSWLIQMESVTVMLVLLLGTALVAPVLEELFFRGLVLRSVLSSPRVPPRLRAGVAVTLSSVLFGLAHLTSADGAGLFVVAQTGLLGAVLAVVALRRGLTIPVAAHVVFNTSGVLLLVAGA